MKSLVPIEERTLSRLRRITMAQFESVVEAVEDGGIDAWKTLGFRTLWERHVRIFVREAWKRGENAADQVLAWAKRRKGPKPLRGDSEGILAKQARFTLTGWEWGGDGSAWAAKADEPAVLAIANVPPAEGLAWYQDYALSLVGVAENDLLDKTKEVVARGTELGLRPADLREELRGVFASFPDYRLSAILRTESAHIYNLASLTRYSQDSAITAYRYLVTLDDRTTEICQGYSDMVVPAGELRDVPPLHFMALPDGEQAITARGLVPVEQIHLGDYVLTHYNRWRRVTAKCRRRYDGEVIQIGLNMLTPEHPLLVRRGNLLTWIAAGDVEPNEELACLASEHTTWSAAPVVPGQPDDLDAIGVEQCCLRGIRLPACFGIVVLPVQLKDKMKTGKVEVAYVRPDGKLEVEVPTIFITALLQDAQHYAFRLGRFTPPVKVCNSNSSAFCGPRIRDSIVRLHPGAGDRVLLALHRMGITLEALILGLTGVSARGYAPNSQLTRDCITGTTKSSGKFQDRFPVSIAVTNRAGIQFQWGGHCEPPYQYEYRNYVISVARFTGFVNDLSVEEDESYVLANGLIAHNCRTVLEPLFAWETFTPSDMTDIEPMKGFGGLWPPGTGLPGVGKPPKGKRK